MSTPPPNPLATAEPWNLVANDYAIEVVPQFQLFAADALRLAQLPPSPRIADVATGPGTLALMAAANGATVSAIDFSATMIANLQRRAAESGVTTVEVVQGDGQNLPFDSGSYDAAFSMFGLIFFPDRAAGFRELHRVLRPGGRAVVSSWAPFRMPFALIMDSIRELLPGLPFGQGQAPLGEPEGFAQELREAGFRDAQIHQITHTVPAPSLAAFWKSAQRNQLGEGEIKIEFAAYLGVGIK